MKHIVRVLECGYATHNVRYFIVEKPQNYSFSPGQATKIAINTPELKDQKRSFTFTSLPENPYLEFTIKMYSDHEDGVTKHFKEIKEGDEIILHDIFGTINYKGPGVFIAGGAGITPFIAILRMLRKQGKIAGNTLIFSNKTSKDIILEHELKNMLKEKCIFTLTRENNSNYLNQRINESFLRENIKDLSQNFYICGPTRMVGELTSILQKLGVIAESIVVET